MKEMNLVTRRSLLERLGGLVTISLVAAPNSLLAQAQKQEQRENETEVLPAEDLMREHGVLNRILLIYEELAKRMKANKALRPDVLADAAGIVHRFIEDYHERLEEEQLFPRFEKAGKYVELVRTLRDQHQSGRCLTQYVKNRATAASLKDPGERGNVVKNLLLFIRMYRPNKAREDTVLFPAFHSIVSAEEYRKLGEEFEEREQFLFGKGGFEKIVEELGVLEKAVGINELTQFTPKI